MLQEMKYYMDCLKTPNTNHRKISNRMSTRFNVSPASVKDALVRGGYIVLDYTKREGETRKFNHYYKLTGKKLTQTAQQEKTKTSEWEDGTPKSSHNAFDWRNSNSSLYSRREIVQAQQKYHNNSQITVYSRA